MNIRPYRESDYSSVVKIYHKSKLDELRFENKPFVLLPLEKDEKRFAAFKESDIFVCEDGGIIGYGALFKSEIRALYIHPNMRGKGIGKQLLEYLLSKIEGQAELFVAKTNVIAKCLYKQYGFIVVDEFETNYNGVSVFANKMIRNTE